MNTILISMVLLGVLGIAIGLLLGVAGKFFAVEVVVPEIVQHVQVILKPVATHRKRERGRMTNDNLYNSLYGCSCKQLRTEPVYGYLSIPWCK